MAFTFGQPQQPAQQQQQAAPGFSFGSGTTGGGITTNNTGFGGFGMQPTQQNKSVSFATPAFGTAASSNLTLPAQQTASFTFSAPRSTAPTLSFGQQQQPVASFGGGNFGGFSSLTAAQPVNPLFNTTPRPLSLFGNTPATTSAFSGFGQPTQQQQQQQQPLNIVSQTHEEQLTRLVDALSKPAIFNDDRDGVIGKLNYIQALLGAGKGIISTNQPPIDLTPKNTFSRFKAYGYLRKPSYRNEDGLVGLIFAKNYRDVMQVKAELKQLIHKLFGAPPQLSIEIDAITPITADTQSELLFHTLVQQQDAAGGGSSMRRLTVDELVRFLSQPNIQQNLAAMSVVDICPRFSSPADDNKNAIDAVPPDGISPFDWYQAINENPRPDVLVPVPLIGMQELREALEREEQMYALIRERIEQVGNIHEHVRTVARERLQERLEQSEQQWRKQSLRLMKLLCRVMSCTDRSSRGGSNAGENVEKFEFKLNRDAERLLQTLYGNGSASTMNAGMSVRLKDLEVSFDAREKHLHQLGEYLRVPLSDRITNTDEPAAAAAGKLAALKQVCASTNATIDTLRRQLERDKIELNEVLQTACSPASSSSANNNLGGDNF